MEKAVVQINQNAKETKVFKRVAAYARVSSGKDAMLHSLAAQIDYYKKLILSNPTWKFAGVFADEAKTGTKEDREQFQELLKLCRAGAIDMVITKSISRLARNTVTLLNTVRELKDYQVDIYFEEQNIHTTSEEGEFMITLLASIAQEESLSVSENCKWRIRNGFEEGKPSNCRMLGYRLKNGEITVVPEEAAIVRHIYDLYLQGYGKQKIANILNDEGIVTINGGKWTAVSVVLILTNEKYCGDLLLQKFYVSDHIRKDKSVNTGQLPRYLIEGNHEAIIDKALYQRVQVERERRTVRKGVAPVPSLFAGMIRCECCGAVYHRKTAIRCMKWCCGTYDKKGKKSCPDSKMIPEETLIEAVCAVLDTDCLDETLLQKRIDHICACKGNVLRFFFKDGTTCERIWKDRSRAESWTPEMKESARRKEAMRWQKRS